MSTVFRAAPQAVDAMPERSTACSSWRKVSMLSGTLIERLEEHNATLFAHELFVGLSSH
jgi:hypothetical protein